MKELQSVLGKLNFIAACIRPGRIFISRLLQWLKILNKNLSSREQIQIPEYVKMDILWWHKFLPHYNGVSLMLYEEWSYPDESKRKAMKFVVETLVLKAVEDFGRAIIFMPLFLINSMSKNTVLQFLKCLLS